MRRGRLLGGHTHMSWVGMCGGHTFLCVGVGYVQRAVCAYVGGGTHVWGPHVHYILEVWARARVLWAVSLEKVSYHCYIPTSQSCISNYGQTSKNSV